MKKLFIRLLFIAVFFSCGIPTYEYISGATVLSSSYSKLYFKINLGDSSIVTSFLLYSRYYIEYVDSKEFEEPELIDLPNGSISYLTNIGFTPVSFDDSETDDYLISNTSNFSIEDIPVSLISDDGESVGLISNYKNERGQVFSHYIGNFSDIEGSNFINEFQKSLDDDTIVINKIFIEFAIINKGLSSNIEHIESVPIYLGSLEMQTIGVF